MTPGSSQSPYHPAAGLGSHDILGSQDWYSPDIEVLIKESHEDTGLCGQIGVVRGVTPGMCSVFLHDEERWGAIILMGIYCRSDMYKLGSLVTTYKQSALLLPYLHISIVVLARTVNIAADHLAPVVPSRGDKVKVILGDEDKDMTGQLLSIDSQVRYEARGLLARAGVILCCVCRRAWSSWITVETSRCCSSSICAR